MIFEFGMFLEFLVALWFGVGALGGMVWMRYGPVDTQERPTSPDWIAGLCAGMLFGPWLWVFLGLHCLASLGLNKYCMKLWVFLTKER